MLQNHRWETVNFFERQIVDKRRWGSKFEPHTWGITKDAIATKLSLKPEKTMELVQKKLYELLFLKKGLQVPYLQACY